MKEDNMKPKRGMIARNERGCLGLITSTKPSDTRQWFGTKLQDFSYEFNGKTWSSKLGSMWQGTEGKLEVLGDIESLVQTNKKVY